MTALHPVAQRELRTGVRNVRSLPNGRWLVAAQHEAQVVGEHLEVERRWEFEPRQTWMTSSVSIDDSGERAALVRWPNVEVREGSRVIAEFTVHEGDDGFGTNALFDGNAIYFIAPDDDPQSDYWLMCANLDTQQIRRVGSTPIVGDFEVLPRRPLGGGLFVTAWDGQHGAQTSFFADGATGPGETIGQGGRQWTAVLDVSPSGDRYFEGGTSCQVRGWPERIPVRLDLPSEIRAPTHFVDGTFLSDTRVALQPTLGSEISMLDLDVGKITAQYQLVDHQGAPLDECIMAGANDHLLVSTPVHNSRDERRARVLLYAL